MSDNQAAGAEEPATVQIDTSDRKMKPVEVDPENQGNNPEDGEGVEDPQEVETEEEKKKREFQEQIEKFK